MTKMSPLRRRMIEDMTVRNLSPATQRSYVHAVAKFGRFFGRSPDKLDLEDVRAFQVHLVAGGISWPALNQIVCALRFLYGVTLRQADLPERIPYAREPQKLPVVLGAGEVVCSSRRCRASSLAPRSPRPTRLDCALLKQRASRSPTSTAAAW
jgi:integrase/recombinase XerD